MKIITNFNSELLDGKSKNVIVSGASDSAKSEFVYDLEQKETVLFCEFDRDKYVLYGKDVNLSADVILKNALFSCSNTVNVADFEAKLHENVTVIIDNFDISYPTPYMRHLFALPCRIVVFADKQMENIPNNCTQIVLANDEIDFLTALSCLDKNEYELLISLSCMLAYLENTTTITSSKCGIFDKDSVDFYFSQFSEKLCSLQEKRLVKIAKNGRVSIPKQVENYVIKELKPKIQDLPTIERLLNGTNYIPCNNELCDISTYFALNDKRCFLDLLKIMISDAASGKEASRLFHRNAPYFVSKLFDVTLFEDNSELRRLCENLLKFKNISASALTSLCTIKVCTYILLGKSTDMYKCNWVVFDTLKNAVDSIMHLENSEREYAAKCAIEYCKSILFDFSAIHQDGTYKAFRDNQIKHTVTNFVNESFYEERANGICFAYSVQTVSLYLSFQRLLCMFPEKYQKQIKLISIHFWRTVKGYNTFYDFFDKKFEGRIDVKDELLLTDKIILDNKRYLARGFDGGTKIGAKRYADMIMSSVENSENALALILALLNPEYPVGDEVYENLLDKGFEKVISNHEKLSNLSKQDILETLVLNFNENEFSKSLVNIYLSIINELKISVVENETFINNMHESACRMYVINVLNNPCCTVSDMLFNMFYIKGKNSKNPEEIVAKAIFKNKTSSLNMKDKLLLTKSIDCLRKQYAMAGIEINEQGFENLLHNLI